MPDSEEKINTMKIVSWKDIGKGRWDEFCLNCAHAWFRHTSTWTEYTLNMRPECESTNLSFGIVDNGELVAILPLVKEALHGKPGFTEFGFAGWNVPFPALANGLGERHRDKVIKAVFAELEQLAIHHNISYSAFEIHPVHTLLDRASFSCNPLPFLGYSSTDIATHIVQLDHDKEALLRNMRKGHRSDITAGLSGGLTAEVFGAETFSDAVFDSYRRIHFNAAGRITRSDATWDLMKQWIRDRLAVLTIVQDKAGKPLAAAFSLVYKDIAYYGSACIEPAHINDRGVMHVLIWETMKHLKARGIRWYETGWQHTPTLSQEVPSAKEINIALFKRGFGGMNVPYCRGERFYSAEFMKETFKERLEKLHAT
jgi:hypothetical protein